MFIAIVDVSLKEEKISEFKAWVTESNTTLSKFDGFISRRLLEGEDGSKRIMVEFTNIELFRKMYFIMNWRITYKVHQNDSFIM